MTHKKLFLQMLTLVGLVLGVLILTMITLTSVQAPGYASIAIAKEAEQTVNFGIEIAKTPNSQMVVSGGTATFFITVTNTGELTLTNVTVSDAQAPNCAASLGALAGGHSIGYECTLTNVTGDFTNSATVTGTPPIGLGNDVFYIDTAFVDVINPGIEIAKTPDVQTVASGSTVAFTIAVTNTGDVPLTNVTISDAQAHDCDQNYTSSLPPGGSERYDCTRTNVTDGFINSAIVAGEPPVGEDVTDADAAKVILDETLTCPTGMIAYWRLDETSSGDYDDYYDGHDGECAGGCPAPATGRVNGGQAFDGSSTWINVPTVPGDDSFNWGAQDSFSIEFWLQTDSDSTCSGNEVIVGRDDSATNLHWWAGCQDGGEAAFYLRDTSGTLAGVIGTTDLTDGSWHHVVAVRAASTSKIHIYVDGIEENSTAATYADGFDSPTAALNIGWLDLSDGFHFDGTVDEIALYDRALSPDEVQQHYNEGLAGQWYCQGATFAPIIVSTPVTSAATGRLYRYDVEAVGSPVPTHTLTIHPSGMTIDSATGLISWIPTAAQEGSHAVEVEASNSAGSNTQNFSIFVTAGTLCPADMIAYWKLDETSGSTYDDFYDGHNGTCAGRCPTPTTGHVGGAQEFNGSDTGINVPADAAFDWNITDNFSIEFWMKRPGAPTGNEVIVGRQGSTHPKPHIWVGVGQWAGNVAAFCLYDTDGIGECVTGETVVTGGDWHHIVAVRDTVTNRIRVYVDGEEDRSVESPSYSAGFDTTTPLNIGWLNLDDGYHFDGTVDEIALYDRALSADEIQQHYNNGEAGPGYCINPDIAVNKTANPMVAYLSDTVIYTYTVTNPGNDPLSDITLNDDKCSPMTSPEGDDGNGYLDPSETWTYHCPMTASADITNTATVTGTHSLGGTVSNTDTISVDVINPGIAIDKTAHPTTVYAGDTVTYTYAVTNPGDDPLSNVQRVSDDKCSPVTFTGGDGNSNYKLDPGEIWTYTCSITVNTDIVNTATVTGTDSAGGTVSAQATASVDVISPDISIVKTADPTTICAGDTVTYTYTVTNPGENPLSAVSVRDDKCAAVIRVGGDTNSDDLLDADETWTYHCVTTLDEDTTNTATATGTNSAGDPISPDTDTAFVDVRDSQITVFKEANDNHTAFEFTMTYVSDSQISHLGTFDLKNGQWAQFPYLLPGNYTISEAVVSEWELLSITCTNGIYLTTPYTPGVTINLQSGEDIRCIFTNFNKGLAEGLHIYLPLVLKN